MTDATSWSCVRSCEARRMRPPRWYCSIPQPLRWAVGSAIILAGVGGIYGVVESVRHYPLSSWFGVTLYLAMLGALAGLLIGLIVGAVFRRS